MKKLKVSMSFKRLSDARLETFTMTVVAAMTRNTNYPNPTPAIADLEALRLQFEAALSAAQTRDNVKIAAKTNLRLQLIAELDTLSDYVNLTAQGDRTILLSSGFKVKAEKTNSAVLGTIENFTVTQGANSGEAILSFTKVKGARFYLFYCAESPAPVEIRGWDHDGDTITSFTFTGLQPGKLYSFKVKAYGSGRQTVFSEVITKMIV
ncbi:MAG: fibronectin type III domain-containing protein [Chitinophagaceae bacterium]